MAADRLRLWEVEVKATVYVVAATEGEAEQIACDRAERDWFDGWADSRPVKAAHIDRAWRDVPPLRDYGEPETEETCREIAEREAIAREVAARQVPLPGVEP